MTDLYRKNGISVILDVVYNHTGEGDANGPMLSLMGLDAKTYYRFVEVDGKQHLVNDTGTGNTLRCDHPAMQRLVIESLRYWVEEMGVSGFRFDLATDPRARAGVQPERRDAADDQDRSGAEQVHPRRRAVGSGSGRLSARPVRQGIPRAQRHLPRRDPLVLARRRRQDRRAGGQGRRLGRDLQFRRPQAEPRRQPARRA